MPLQEALLGMIILSLICHGLFCSLFLVFGNCSWLLVLNVSHPCGARTRLSSVSLNTAANHYAVTCCAVG